MSNHNDKGKQAMWEKYNKQEEKKSLTHGRKFNDTVKYSVLLGIVWGIPLVIAYLLFPSWLKVMSKFGSLLFS